MKIMCRRAAFLVSAMGLCLPSSVGRADVVDFQDLTVPAGGSFDGNPGNLSPGQSVNTAWVSGSVAFSNTFGIDNYGNFNYEWWQGFSYSNVINTTDATFGNQYASYPGGGYQSTTYAVPHTEYDNYQPTVTLPGPATVSGFRIANTTYTALTLRDGDQYGFAAPLQPGGWYATTAIGKLGGTTTGSATFYLADLRTGSSPGIIATWQWFDLSSLGTVDRIDFEFSGSDMGAFGLNTPRYFALDDLTFSAVPEPATAAAVGFAAIAAMALRGRYVRSRRHDA